jgi:hypothetical protein
VLGAAGVASCNQLPQPEVARAELLTAEGQAAPPPAPPAEAGAGGGVGAVAGGRLATLEQRLQALLDAPERDAGQIDRILAEMDRVRANS